MSRRNLSREMLLNKTLSIQTESLKRENEELESRNEILINSHNMFEEKWTKIVNAFEFYKDFYKKHQEMLSSRKSPTSPNRSILHSDVKIRGWINNSMFNNRINFFNIFLIYLEWEQLWCRPNSEDKITTRELVFIPNI